MMFCHLGLEFFLVYFAIVVIGDASSPCSMLIVVDGRCRNRGYLPACFANAAQFGFIP